MEIISAYQPQPHQSRFHASPARFKWFLGGVGSGKSLSGMHELLFLAEDNPKCDGLIGVPTYRMFQDVVMPLWRDWVPSQLYTFHKGEQSVLWHPTGRRFFVRSATEPDRASGLNIGFGWFDELALVFKSKFWEIAQARLRQPATRPCLVVTSTPNGMNWLARWFRSRRDVHITRCRTRDNAKLPDGFEAQLRSSYGEEMAAQYLDAMILDLMGLAWPLHAKMHGSLPLDEIKKRMTHRFGAVDWGHTNPAAVLVGGTDQDGRWYLAALWYKRGHTRDQIAKQAAKMAAEWKVEQWYIDHDPEGQAQMEKQGLPVMRAEKEVVSGLMHVRSLVPPRADGQPRIQVHESLKDWWREQEAYTFPEGEEEPVGQNGDHAMDATRYMIYTHSLTWAATGGIQAAGGGRSWDGY
jgi:hypothetical protein